MRRKKALLFAVMLAITCLLPGVPPGAAEQKPTTARSCAAAGCHPPAERILRGNLAGISWNAKTIQINTGSQWLVRFDEDTRLIGAEKWSKLAKDKEIAIVTQERKGELYAISVSVKPPVKVAPGKLISLDELSRLVAIGPERGNFVLVDSRPAARFSEGHIPGAVSLYDADFDRLKDRLPKDKDKPVVFYCAGSTCRLSASSARRAEQAGYTKVRVFLDGMPAWKKAGNLVLSSPYYIRELMDKEIPAVIIDLRPTDESRDGHIPEAVSIPEKDMRQAKEKFPAERSAPIVLYANDTQAPMDEFKIIRGWGYTNVSVLEGGIDSWKRIGGLIVKGDVASRITYVPRLKPGEISPEEFRRIAETLPPDKILVDVRDQSEAGDGILKGAVNIPAGDLARELKDLPKDKEIITFCLTGSRGEMAYHMLKEAGYKARYLNASLRIGKDGRFSIIRE